MDNTIAKVSHDACTGCGACLNKCPVNAIKMEYDSEGFLFPKIDETCIHCGQCLASCPAEHPLPLHETPKSYAVWAQDDIRLKSSSGGMFTLLSDYVLEKGGAVCGAVYAPDFQTVYHAWAESKEELAPLRGSKYVQSDTGLAYRQAKEYLDAGRLVLYTGCPCQIAGLYRYLGKDYDNLYTADLVCHGSNSVSAYQSFLKEFSQGQEIEKVDFRDKKYFTWSTPTVVYLKNGNVKKAAWNEGTWYKGFLEGVINRLNCYQCPYARAERVADVTMADCWQIYRLNLAYDDRKGTSLVLVNSEKGKQLFRNIQDRMKLCEEVPLDFVRQYNGQLNKPTPKHPSRQFFFSHLKELGYHNALWYGRGLRFDVGLVGWWFASNYGSSLTYYALGQILQDMGKQVLFIPIPKRDGEPWEKETQQTIDFLSRYFRVGNERDIDRMDEFNGFCDSFMLGSDQMWTVGSTKQVGYTFFLDFVEKGKKKIAFSTSFGHGNFNADPEMRATASDYLKRFDAVSVREKSGVEICRDVLGIQAEQVMDPVFLCGTEQYDQMLSDISETLPKRYLLCYILDPDETKEKAAREIAEHEGLEILTILGMKEYGWAIHNWSTGTILPKVTTPQFLYYIKHCDFLLTDSHHGACFGIIYQKQYVAMANPNRGKTRFATVAEVLHLESRVVDEPGEILNNESIYEKIDYNRVAQYMKPEVERAKQWLLNALECPTKTNEDTLHTVANDASRKICGLGNRLEKSRRYAEQLNAQVAELQRQKDELWRREEEHNRREEELLRRIEMIEQNYEPKLHWLKRKTKGGIQCLKDNGVLYTIKRVCQKVKNKLR